MTERETASFDGAPACPFLALVDDRDARFDRPDRSHRCYAESPPAPRATAHQIAFCLGASFSSCPTFVDWARREVARVKAPDPWRATDDDERVGPEPEPRGGRRPSPQGSAGASAGESAGRPYDHRRDWAAPPPWAAESATGAGAGTAGGRTAGGEPAAADRDRTDGPAGAAADGRSAADDESRAPSSRRDDAGSAATTGAAATPAFLAGRSRASETPPIPGPSGRPASRPTQSVTGAGWDERGTGGEPDRGPAGGTGASRPRPSSRQRSIDRGAPAWEEPRHYEAYPTIRSRARLPGLSPVLVGVAAIAIAAVALFFLPPMFLGLGGDASPTPEPSPSAEITPAPTPTPAPEPEQEVYVVKSGDTLSKIASGYGLSVDELLAANPQITDANKIQVGDRIVIPQPVPSEIVDPGAEEASPVP